MLYTGLLLGI